jgi:hypothetical protein
MRAPGQRPRGLPVCLPGTGGPQGILRVHAVYFAELAGRKEVADERADEIGSGIQRGLNAQDRLSIGNVLPFCEFGLMRP